VHYIECPYVKALNDAYKAAGADEEFLTKWTDCPDSTKVTVKLEQNCPGGCTLETSRRFEENHRSGVEQA
jgi:hypothetical protein